MKSFMLHLCCLLILFFTTQPSTAEVYPRFNKGGYFSKAPKNLVIMADETLEGKKWQIINSDKLIVAEGIIGNSISGKSAHTPKPFNYSIDFSTVSKAGKYSFQLDGLLKFSIEIKANPYADLIPEMVQFLKGQRSGVETPPDNLISHSGDSKCRIYERINNLNTKWEPIGGERYVDMMGGWYDAGDYLKFTLTTAYTTYFLLRAYEIYPENPQNKEIKKMILDEATWGLSYLMKTMPDDKTFIIQVGNADDHKQGDRNPYLDQLNGKRNAYSTLSATQMGYTAAALALGAQLTKETSYRDLSNGYQAKAEQIYKNSLPNIGNAAWFEEGWEKFYADDSGADNMQLAATELYRLTKNENYLAEAKLFAYRARSAYWCSWANSNMHAHLRLMEFASLETKEHLEVDLNYFNEIATKQGNVWGVPHNYTWATLYSFIGVGAAALHYHSAYAQNSSYEKMGIDVLNYTLGLNNWGSPFVISRSLPGSVKNIYSQRYKLNPMTLVPYGAIAEGPGDRKTHDELMQYFSIPAINPYENFNTSEVVFYDNNSDFQCMETTISGMADGIYFFSLVNKLYSK